MQGDVAHPRRAVEPSADQRSSFFCAVKPIELVARILDCARPLERQRRWYLPDSVAPDDPRSSGRRIHLASGFPI